MTLSPAQERSNPGRPFLVPVAGGRLSVRDLGRGPAVLLLHGISADHTEWTAVTRELVADHRVILPDLIGRGASLPDPDASFGFDEECDRIAALLDRLGVEAPLVAGHSHGASLGLGLARRRRLAGLLMVSPVTPWTKRPRLLDSLSAGIVRRCVEPILRTCRRPLTRYILTRRVYGERAPHIGNAVERYAAPYADRARARALLRIFRDWRPAATLEMRPPEGLPVALLTGAADRRISVEEAMRWADRLGAPCTIVDGAGHGLTEEAPGRVAEEIRRLEARGALEARG